MTLTLDAPRASSASWPGRLALDSRNFFRAGLTARAAILVLIAVSVLAGAVRLHGLAGPDGRLNKDEAKLALAADGVLRSGLPLMPSGRLYTRGLLNSYLIASSFAVVGRSDFGARLPSAIAGILLVPVVFLLARPLGGPLAGLGAASFVALAQPLVEWSAAAWLPSLYLLLLAVTVLAWYCGYVRHQARWQVVGGLSLCLALLCYEFAVLLLGAIGAYLLLRLARRDLRWYQGGPSLLALGLLAASGLLFVWLALAIRAGTLAGPMSEIKGYVEPALDPSTALVYYRAVFAEYLPLIVLAVLGWPFVLGRSPQATILLTVVLAVLFLIPSFLLQSKTETRYMLPALALLSVLAAGGICALVEAACARLRLPTRWSSLGSALALLFVLGAALWADLPFVVDRLRQRPPGSTWVQTLQQQPVQADDLLLTEGPERLRFYFGRTDFHVYFQREFGDSEDAQDRYSYQASDGIRSIYTNSLLLHNEEDFEQLVEQPNRGRTLWVVGTESTLRRLTNRMDPDLWPSLTRSARRQVHTDDGWIILRVGLPLRYRHE